MNTAQAFCFESNPLDSKTSNFSSLTNRFVTSEKGEEKKKKEK